MINTNPIGSYSQQQNIDDIYKRIAQLQSSPVPNYRTVFNDISDEWNNCNEEERQFIENDSEYIKSNLSYAQQFNAFLIEQFGLQFANSKYGTSAEQVLVSIRNAKGRYHSAAAEDVKRIKDENAALQQQLKELEELINAK